MARYLDPKNDLTFKRIFGEHPDLLISFLNALMPLTPGQEIQSIQYLPAEQVPDNPVKKNSIVDVRCTDNFGRQFIVEMQMCWNDSFSNRMVFNAAKAYVRQLDTGENYDLLQTVYGLGITNDIFDHKTPEFYHHYQTINCKNSEEVIKGLEFVLVELPKFKPEKWAHRKMAVLWLRFLKEVKDEARTVPPELLSDRDIKKAVDLCEEGAFTPEELATYEKYWDIVSTEKAMISSSLTKGEALGIEKGRAEGRAEGLTEGEAIGLEKGEAIGMEKGRAEELRNIVLSMQRKGFSPEQIRDITNLPKEKIAEILGA